jgi:hypothetical protein
MSIKEKPMLTDTEKAQLITLANNLKATPRTWAGLSLASKMLIARSDSFVQEQRNFFGDWWLEVTDAIVASINSKLPANTRCEPRIDLLGRKWINVDLFTDIDGRLLRILADIRNLPFVFKLTADWPVLQGA